MLSEKRNSSRSPSESVHTDSIRTGPTSHLVLRQSHHSSNDEGDDNDNIPTPPPPPSPNYGTKAKSPSSSASSIPSRPTPKPTNSDTNAAKAINAIAFQRPPARRKNSDEQNNSKRRNHNQTTTPSASKRAIGGLFGRVSARDIENEKPTSTYISQSRQGKPKQSIFEKVHTHGGGTTYLGAGTFSQLENCIRKCLSEDQPHQDFINYNTTHDFPYKSLTRASVLEDYSYDGISSPHHHITHSASSHHRFSHHTKHAAELSLDEIRQVNDALAKYGIPVFSHHEHPNNLYNKPRPVGDIISACQQLLADPLLRSQRDGSHAVQHVWDNLHNHSPQMNMYGNASPAVQGVASHLFYPTHQPQQSSYNPGQSAISKLFGNPQQSPYNPGQGTAPNPYGNPQQSSSSSGQSVLSRLFSGQPQQQQQQNYTAPPYGTSFQQYPGNNPYPY